MTRRRLGLLVGAALLAFLVEPAAAQTSSSVTERVIWDLNMNLLYIAVPITILVEGILIYAVLRFRKNEDPLPTRENRRLEITWTIATAIILLVVGIGSYGAMGHPYVSGPGDQVTTEDGQEPLEVTVVGQRYSWRFYYNGTAANASQPVGPDNRLMTTGTLYLPTDRPIELHVTSTDWLHSFHVPGLALKQDAFPGQINTIRTRITETGAYQLYCAEYCGSGHSRMLGTVEVQSPEEFQATIESEQSG